MCGQGELRAGLLCDVWSMEINWLNDQDTPIATSGTSKIAIVQPWLRGGYFLCLAQSRLVVGAGIGLGREINVSTQGKEVAQGWMGSIFLEVGFKLSK